MSLAGFNLSWLGFALAELREAWSLEPWQLSLPMVASAIGGICGSAAGGQLADRFGRRGVFQIAIAGCALGTLLSAGAPNLGGLVVGQMILGAGVTGMTPAATSLVTEIAPTGARGRLTALLETFWVLGTLLAAISAYLLIPLMGWRGAMALGALALLYIWVVRGSIPESPRFLVARGYIADAFALRDRLAVRWGVDVALPMAEARPGLPLGVAGRLRELWSPAYRQRTLVLWCLWFVLVFIYRGVFTWLPTLLILVGQTAHDARFSLVLITLAQLPGTLVAAMLVDRVGRKPLLVVGLGAASLAALVFGLVAETAIIAVLVGAAMSAFFMGGYSAGLVYTPELYPTRARATGVGMASSFGRIAAILAPPTVSGLLVLGAGSLFPIFAVFAAALAGGAFVVGLLGEETRGRLLEEVSR